ncbi:MAG: bifunctional nuclease family protein [Muribaculaceae bacterium]|nr:bifunctional nuclease family protein [Muribaculaceae bacterium]
MEKRYRLELVGITFNQIESGVYALILQQVGSDRRIPIVIGFPEAQAIQCKLQEVSTPRPLTHDTMVAALEAFGIKLKEVEIKRLPNGVFAADLFLSNGEKLMAIDSRSSDAIALAIRVGAPIYTTESVLKEAGIVPEKNGEEKETDYDSLAEKDEIKNIDLSEMTLDQLHAAMANAAENENYEEAAKIKKEINRRTEKSDSE